MRRPLKPRRRIIRIRLPKLLPIIKHCPEIAHFGGDAPTAVGVNRRYLPWVPTVLAEAAEEQGVKESDFKAKFSDDSAMDEL